MADREYLVGKGNERAATDMKQARERGITKGKHKECFQGREQSMTIDWSRKWRIIKKYLYM